MSSQLATRIIDGDGHIMEDNAGIIPHMDSPYREIAERKGVIFPPLDHLHAGRAVETPPQRDQRPAVGREREQVARVRQRAGFAAQTGARQLQHGDSDRRALSSCAAPRRKLRLRTSVNPACSNSRRSAASSGR